MREVIDRMMRILFVCTGNTCRSPMAAAIARKIATERGITDLEFTSAGTTAWDGQPATDCAVLIGIERQWDLDAHRSRTLTREMVEAQDLILAMGSHHKELAEAAGGAGKTYLLTTYATHGAEERSIADPFGGDLETYRATADELEEAIRRAVDRLAAERTPDLPT
jgi:protein-tyrosine-phosphatase